MPLNDQQSVHSVGRLVAQASLSQLSLDAILSAHVQLSLRNVAISWEVLTASRHLNNIRIGNEIEIHPLGS